MLTPFAICEILHKITLPSGWWLRMHCADGFQIRLEEWDSRDTVVDDAGVLIQSSEALPLIRDWWLQIVFEARCVDTHNMEVQYCRKWRLTPHMTETEIVNSVWLAVEVAGRHEAAEAFRYCGLAINNGHIPITTRVVASWGGVPDVRADPLRESNSEDVALVSESSTDAARAIAHGV